MRILSFSKDVKVYLEDTDALGIVYHSNYLKFVERCKADLLEKINANDRLSAESLMIVLKKEEIEFINPSRVGDLLVVSVHLEQMLFSSSYLTFEILCNGVDIAKGNFRVAVINSKTLKMDRFPSWFLSEIKSLAS